MILVYITCSNKNEARKIGRALVKERLVACVNVFPIESIYRWKGKLVEDKEVVLIVKTFKKNFAKLEELVKKLHSYKTPCIFSIPVEKFSKDYLEWLKKETT